MLCSLQIEDYHYASGRIPCQNVKQNAVSCFIIDLKLGALNLKSLAPKSKHRPLNLVLKINHSLFRAEKNCSSTIKDLPFRRYDKK